MNFYNLFYWISVADGVKKFFDTASDVFTTLAIITFVVYVIASVGVSACTTHSEENDKIDENVRSWKKLRLYIAQCMYPFIALAILLWAGYVFTPSKKDALIIVAGGAVGNFITRDTAARALPSEVMNLLRSKIRQEINEASLVGTVDTLKSKTKEELEQIIRDSQK